MKGTEAVTTKQKVVETLRSVRGFNHPNIFGVELDGAIRLKREIRNQRTKLTQCFCNEFPPAEELTRRIINAEQSGDFTQARILRAERLAVMHESPYLRDVYDTLSEEEKPADQLIHARLNLKNFNETTQQNLQVSL
jgi:hypothetical protein